MKRSEYVTYLSNALLGSLDDFRREDRLLVTAAAYAVKTLGQVHWPSVSPTDPELLKRLDLYEKLIMQLTNVQLPNEPLVRYEWEKACELLRQMHSESLVRTNQNQRPHKSR